jgi:hypothetical protein
MLFAKLRSYVGQQHIGLLALFVALGGSAYAAAKIRSKHVVNDSLTGADIRGRAASGKQRFTQGSLTGADVRGSAAAGGRPAVDGSLTGDDFKDGSLTPADLLDESLTGLDVLESSLGPVPKAADADTIAGNGPQAFATVVRTNTQNTGTCDVLATLNECAPVTITVPEGRRYRAAVWSSLSIVNQSGSSQSAAYCAGIRNVSSLGPKTCLTEGGEPTATVELPTSGPQSAATSGDTSQLNLELAPGTWTFSTMIRPTSDLLGNDPTFQSHTTVLITDAAAPGLPGVPDDTCCTTSTSGGSTSSGASSGGSSGASSGGSSGTSSGGSSGASSGGSSGTTSG